MRKGFLSRLLGQQSPDHAYAAAARAIFGYLASETEELDVLESYSLQVDQILRRHNGPHPSLVRTYLAWEEHLATVAEGDVGESRARIRAEAGRRARLSDLDRSFRAVFVAKRERNLFMLEFLLEHLANSIIKSFGAAHLESSLEQLPEEIQTLVEVDGESLSTARLHEALRDDPTVSEGEIVRRFKAAVSVLLARLSVFLGPDAARGVLTHFIRETRTTYQAEFIEPIVVAVPEHMLEADEWLSRLSRAELEREVQEQTSELETLNRSLEVKVEDRTEDLKRAYEELRELDARKSEFLSVAAHQLRTPLSGIRWALHSLRDGEAGALSERQTGLVNQSLEAAERLLAIVADMLNTEYIRAGKVRYDLAPTPLAPLVDQVLFALAEKIRARRIHVENDADQGGLSVLADRGRLFEALLNLADNAVKYGREGGRLKLGARQVGGTVEVTVEDDGIGIPADDQRHIFERFFRAKNAVRVQTSGSGLGLFIAKAVVEGHGGTISFESSAEQGTTFRVQLRAAPGGAA